MPYKIIKVSGNWECSRREVVSYVDTMEEADIEVQRLTDARSPMAFYGFSFEYVEAKKDDIGVITLEYF